MADLGKNLKTIWMKGMEAIGNTASNIASNTKYKVDEMNLLNRRREILSDFGAKAYAMWQKGDYTDFPEELKRDLEELTRLDNQLVDMRAEHFGGEDAVEGEATAAETKAADVPEAPEATGEAEKNAAEPEEAEEPESAAEPEAAEEPEELEEPEQPEEPEKPESAEGNTVEESAKDVPVIQVGAPETTSADNSETLSMEEISRKSSAITDAINDLFDQVPSVDAMAEKMNDTLDQMGDRLKKFSDGLDEQIQKLSDQLDEK